MASSSGGGVGLSTLLGVLFIGLKLAGVIDWPWLWVLSPLWISLGIGLMVIFVALVLAYVTWIRPRKM